MAPPRKPAPKITEERKGTIGTGQKPGPLFNPPPVTRAAPAPARQPAGPAFTPPGVVGTGRFGRQVPATGGAAGGGGKGGQPAGGGKGGKPGGGGMFGGGGNVGGGGRPVRPVDIPVDSGYGGGGRDVGAGDGEGDSVGGDFGAAMGLGSVSVPSGPFSASQLMENLLYSATGIRGLGAWAAGLYNAGATPTEIIQALRYGTDSSSAGQAAYKSYLDAFPKMDVFIREGIFSGDSPELQYIAYRNTAREAARRYGIIPELVDNNKIASYIEKRVSAAELADRMGTAATASATTPTETFAVLRDYYGVDSGDLVSFYLNPDVTEAVLQRRYTAARIGTEAARQKFGINVGEAENLAQRGVTPSEATTAFGTASDRTAFMQGRGEMATREEVLASVFGDAEAARKVERLGKTRTGAFQGGGGFVQAERGMGGLGTAAT